MVKVFEVCPLDRQLLNNTTKVVLRRVTYFLVGPGCIECFEVVYSKFNRPLGKMLASRRYQQIP